MVSKIVAIRNAKIIEQRSGKKTEVVKVKVGPKKHTWMIKTF